MNNENLKKGKATQFRTGEEQAKTAAKGGRKSGEVRRKLKSERERYQRALTYTRDGQPAEEGEMILRNLADIAAGRVKGNATEAAKLILKMAGEFVEQSAITVDAKETAAAAIERVMKEIKQ